MKLTGSLLVALAIVFILVGPFISIWALNTLFSLGISYTFKTWLAMAVLHIILAGGNSNNGSSK